MKIGNITYDHIEVFDETGTLVSSISDDEIIKKENWSVNLCENDVMFKAKDEFEQACRPLMKYLANNHHPHTIVLVSSINSEMLEGIKSYNSEDFIPD